MRIALSAIAISFVVLLIFHAGIAVGSRRSSWGRVPAPGFGSFAVPRGFIERGHGVVGTIESTHGTSSLSIKTRSGALETIRLSSTTEVFRGPSEASSTLSAGEDVLILGEPADDGSVRARLIRPLPHSF